MAEPTFPRGIRWRLLWALPLLLGGCLEGRRAEIDPLLGGPPLPTQGTPSPSATASTSGGNIQLSGRPPTSPLPLPSAPASSSSQAVLASGLPPVKDTAPQLRINSGTPPQPITSWQNPAGGPTATLQAPQAIAQTAGAQGITPPSTSMGIMPVATSTIVPVSGSAPIDSYQQAMQALDARGVTWRSLTKWGNNDEWQLSCAIPSRQNPSTQHKYEARAVGENGLAAIRAVIEQIDKDQR